MNNPYNGGEMLLSIDDIGNMEQWWEIEDWYIDFNGKSIMTPAGELADLFVTIAEYQEERRRYMKSKKRQHIAHAKEIKQTLLFLTWVFGYCERNFIGTTAFYALLATDNID